MTAAKNPNAYVLLALLPLLGVIAAVVIFAVTSYHRHTAGLRLYGAPAEAVVEGRYMSSTKQGPLYYLEYRYSAFDTVDGKTVVYHDEGQATCADYNALKPGDHITIIVDRTRPGFSALDLHRTFKAGLSEQAFQVWRRGGQVDDRYCYASRS